MGGVVIPGGWLWPSPIIGAVRRKEARAIPTGDRFRTREDKARGAPIAVRDSQAKERQPIRNIYAERLRPSMLPFWQVQGAGETSTPVHGCGTPVYGGEAESSNGRRLFGSRDGKDRLSPWQSGTTVARLQNAKFPAGQGLTLSSDALARVLLPMETRERLEGRRCTGRRPGPSPRTWRISFQRLPVDS